jgi:energy-converting hydrogenase Eha subunit A
VHRQGCGRPVGDVNDRPLTQGDQPLRVVWLAIIMLASVVVALGVVVVLLAIGTGIVTVMAMSGTAFAGSITIGIAVRTYLDGRH